MESIDDESNQSTNDFAYDTSKLLQLLESISPITDSTLLQRKVNVYLKELLETPHVLMVPLLQESQEGLIQVVNDRTLDKEFRFSVSRQSSPKKTKIFHSRKSPIFSANMEM
jgi:RNA polymerase-interacting CarD/CdnL/TRCF family regulator